MMIIRGGVAALDGRDFREWNAVITAQLTGELGAFTRSYETRSIDGRDGDLITKADPVTKGRVIQIPLAMEHPSHAACVAAIEDLQHYCERGPRRLTLSHYPNTYWRVRITNFGLAPGRPRMTSRRAFGTLTFVAPAGVRYSLDPFFVSIVDNTERVPIPIGRGDVAPVFRSSGGNQQEIILRNQRGVEVARQRLAVDLTAAPDDFILVDNGEESVFRSTASVLTPADGILQGSYLTLSSRFSDREANAWATLEVTNGRLEVSGRITERA